MIFSTREAISKVTFSTSHEPMKMPVFMDACPGSIIWIDENMCMRKVPPSFPEDFLINKYEIPSIQRRFFVG